MKSALNNVNSWVGGIVGLLKTVIVFFVFVNILYVTNVNPIGGISWTSSPNSICFFLGLISRILNN